MEMSKSTLKPLMSEKHLVYMFRSFYAKFLFNLVNMTAIQGFWLAHWVEAGRRCIHRNTRPDFRKGCVLIKYWVKRICIKRGKEPIGNSKMRFQNWKTNPTACNFVFKPRDFKQMFSVKNITCISFSCSYLKYIDLHVYNSMCRRQENFIKTSTRNWSRSLSIN